MTGRNIARYMRLDRLIPEFKDAVDKGTLAMVAGCGSVLSECEDAEADPAGGRG